MAGPDQIGSGSFGAPGAMRCDPGRVCAAQWASYPRQRLDPRPRSQVPHAARECRASCRSAALARNPRGYSRVPCEAEKVTYSRGVLVSRVEGSSRTPRVVIISPCRDEQATLPRTIAALERQTRRPDLWVVVDDGSHDATPAILAEAAKRLPWLRVIHRTDRGFRKLGSGVIDAFYEGLESVDSDYDFVAKLDVDLDLPPRYIERLLVEFERDPKLAAASGKVYREENGGLVSEFIIDEMVAGQFKFYRREAFERIGGFVRGLMWDGIDFHRARMLGYRTASIDDPDLRILHLRLMGSSDRSIYRGRLRWGEGQWFMGAAFPYVVASGVFRMRENPLVIGGLLIITGYLLAALRGTARYDDLAFRRDLRAWQYRRLGLLLRGEPASIRGAEVR